MRETDHSMKYGVDFRKISLPACADFCGRVGIWMIRVALRGGTLKASLMLHCQIDLFKFILHFI